MNKGVSLGESESSKNVGQVAWDTIFISEMISLEVKDENRRHRMMMKRHGVEWHGMAEEERINKPNGADDDDAAAATCIHAVTGDNRSESKGQTTSVYNQYIMFFNILYNVQCITCTVYCTQEYR